MFTTHTSTPGTALHRTRRREGESSTGGLWGGLAVALGIAFVVTVPVNRALIRRGKGHAVVHQYHH